jgi:diapolycopene oxygenase
MLAFFTKYVGSSPYDSPSTLNLLAYSQMGYGLWYVRGGMYNLARAYETLLRELGVTIHLDAEVTAIPKRGRAVRGVTLADGREVSADVVVCNMEVIPAYRRLLGERGLWMKRYEQKYEPAASGLVLHFGIDRAYPQLEHHNFFFARDPEEFLHTIHRRKQLPDDPNIYLVYPTKTNAAVAPEGHHIIKALPHIPYVQDPPFAPREYQALRERVVDKLERMGLTDLRKHIVTEDMLVPEDLERMYYSNKGAIYGVVNHRRKNMAFKAPKRSERYDNLYFVGGSVNPGGGTCMAVAGGTNVARQVAANHS